MTILETARLRLRNWRDADRALFAEINSDPEVMEFFPRRRDRAECDLLMEEARRRIDESGLGFYALAFRDSDEAIGFCGLARTDLAPVFADGTVEIGWRLARRFWGQGYVTEAARALLTYGFETHGLAEIVSFAVPQNARSRAVMARIGLRPSPERDFVHPRIPESRPDLQTHVVYAISRQDYQAVKV